MSSWIAFLVASVLLIYQPPAWALRTNHLTNEEGCTSEAICQPLATQKCLGTTLKYSYTTLKFVDGFENQTQVQAALNNWKRLRIFPKCWDVIQTVLCSVYMPKCTPYNSSYSQSDHVTSDQIKIPGFVDLPNNRLCELIKEPCRLVAEQEGGWPKELDCDRDHFTTECFSMPYRSLRFNNNDSGCMLPLVPTENKHSWYAGVDGCGVQCFNPFFTSSQHESAHFLTMICGIACLICNTFALLTLLLDWSTSKSYPTVIIFYINVCFLIGCCGWLVQFIPTFQEDVVCRRDGTSRRSEPQIESGETLSCTLVFIIVYFFLLSAVLWFAILTFSWHLGFKVLGRNSRSKDVMKGKKGTFHLIAWCIPIILVISTMAMTQIDGDSLSGICFVGVYQHTYRVIFVLLPIGLTVMVGVFFLISGINRLRRLQQGGATAVGKDAARKIRSVLFKQIIFLCMVLFWLLVMVLGHAYIFINQPKWNESFKRFIMCQAGLVKGIELNSCSIEVKPNFWIIQAQILSYFGAGISMSFWFWSKASWKIWRSVSCRCGSASDKKDSQRKSNHADYQQEHAPLRSRGPSNSEDAIGEDC